MNSDDLITTKTASEKLGVSTRTIRYFCDRGYILHVKRNHLRQRVLSPEQFNLLQVLVRMKQSGFSKTEIKRYAKLARQGRSTAAERLAILTTRKHQLENEIKECQTAIDFIERQEEIAGLIKS